jgi:ribosome-associated toxin RatA of RatAB toxin-antitoxin module
MGKELSYRVEQPCRASPAAVYGALIDVERYPTWMPDVSAASWERRGTPNNEKGAIRRIRTRGLTVREEITGSEPPNHQAYTALSGAPVKDYRANISIADHPGGCTIIWEATFTSRVPVVGPLIQKSTRSSIAKIAAALAREAERRS